MFALRHHAPALVLVLALTAACGDTDVDPPPASDGGDVEVDAGGADAGSPGCAEAASHSDLEWIQDEIFSRSCAAFSVCHQGAANGAGGLSLEEGQSFDELVRQPSRLFPEWTLVVPGNPDMSYLMVILGHVEGPIDEDVGTMPQNNPLLCPEKREAISRWILSMDGAAASGALP